MGSSQQAYSCSVGGLAHEDADDLRDNFSKRLLPHLVAHNMNYLTNHKYDKDRSLRYERQRDSFILGVYEALIAGGRDGR